MSLISTLVQQLLEFSLGKGFILPSDGIGLDQHVYGVVVVSKYGTLSTNLVSLIKF